MVTLYVDFRAVLIVCAGFHTFRLLMQNQAVISSFYFKEIITEIIPLR